MKSARTLMSAAKLAVQHAMHRIDQGENESMYASIMLRKAMYEENQWGLGSLGWVTKMVEDAETKLAE